MSKRYGSPKAFAKLDDKYFYELSIQALAGVSEQTIVVARPEFQNSIRGNVEIITDDEEFFGCGPLAGIYSVMNSFSADRYAVLPCDMPYIGQNTMKLLLDLSCDEDVIAVEDNGKQHPLVAVYSNRVEGIIREDLEKGQFSVMKLLEKVDVRWIKGSQLTPYPEEVFRNVNTPEIVKHEGRRANGIEIDG